LGGEVLCPADSESPSPQKMKPGLIKQSWGCSSRKTGKGRCKNKDGSDVDLPQRPQELSCFIFILFLFSCFFIAFLGVSW
jgi:hypothetical protein